MQNPRIVSATITECTECGKRTAMPGAIYHDYKGDDFGFCNPCAGLIFAAGLDVVRWGGTDADDQTEGDGGEQP